MLTSSPGKSYAYSYNVRVRRQIRSSEEQSHLSYILLLNFLYPTTLSLLHFGQQPFDSFAFYLQQRVSCQLIYYYISDVGENWVESHTVTRREYWNFTNSSQSLDWNQSLRCEANFVHFFNLFPFVTNTRLLYVIRLHLSPTSFYFRPWPSTSPPSPGSICPPPHPSTQFHLLPTNLCLTLTLITIHCLFSLSTLSWCWVSIWNVGDLLASADAAWPDEFLQQFVYCLNRKECCFHFKRLEHNFCRWSRLVLYM